MNLSNTATKEEQLQNEKLFIRLSGHFLAVQLEDNFFDLDYDEQLKYIEDHACKPFAHGAFDPTGAHDGSYVYSLIDNLTDHVMSIIEQGEFKQ